jgi:pimeloyl-ACP methyl ester carboxylesterase
VATFVLVHGAFGGAWNWDNIVPLLEAEGHTVDPVDLPGHGGNPAPVAEMTLANNSRWIADRVEAASEPVVLVGHSMGGMGITQAAELVPDRVATLVYVAAFLPGDGMTLVQLAEMEPNVDGVQPNIVLDQEHGTCTIAADAVRDVLFAECRDEVGTLAAARLVPESLAVMVTPVQLSAGRAGSVPRVYIECTLDRAIGIEKQRAMHAAIPCAQVFTLATDHAPFLSTPRELADCLLAVAS